MMRTASIYVLAAVAEIAGCFSLWLWLRSGRSGWLVVPGAGCLFLFAWLLVQVPASAAGRAYAAYGGVYIATSMLWLWAVEGIRPDRWDVLGVTLCLAGAAVIVLGGHRVAVP